MSTKLAHPRTINQLYQAAASPALIKRSEALLAEAERFHKIRDRLRFPSDRLTACEDFFGKKLLDLDPSTRGFVEQVAIAHDPHHLAQFAEAYIQGAIDGLPTAPIIKEFNARLVEELLAEIESVTAWLAAAFDATGQGGVEAAAPIQFLEHRLFLARNAAAAGTGGGGGVQSILSGLK